MLCILSKIKKKKREREGICQGSGGPTTSVVASRCTGESQGKDLLDYVKVPRPDPVSSQEHDVILSQGRTDGDVADR